MSLLLPIIMIQYFRKKVLKMKKIVITGGTGFIGLNLVEYLISTDFDTQITVISNREEDRKLMPAKVQFVCDDLSSCEVLVAKMRKCNINKPYAFYHLAWAGVSSAMKNNMDIQLQNINMAIVALKVCKEIGGEKFIDISSPAEFARASGLITGYDRPTPCDAYSVIKNASHYWLDINAEIIKQPIIHAIVCSTFGEYRNDNNIISYTINSLLNNEPPLYGSLNQMWDFLYVKDTVRALALIGQFGHPDNIYAIGSDTFKPLNEYITIIRNLINPSLPIQIGALADRYKDVYGSCLDTTTLHRDINFKPEYSFEEGIERTIKYFKGQKNEK